VGMLGLFAVVEKADASALLRVLGRRRVVALQGCA
jgi:hypothetical protein